MKSFEASHFQGWGIESGPGLVPVEFAFSPSGGVFFLGGLKCASGELGILDWL